MTPATPATARSNTPLVLHPELRLSPEQFALVCEANPDAVLELSAGGHLISMTPTGGDTSARNAALLYALQHYARSQGGWKVLDSSGGFRLPVAARLQVLEAGPEFPALQLRLAEIWAG